MFSNPKNNSRWPVEITSDIVLHFEDFRKTLTYYVSLAQGKTALVVPEQAKIIENFNVDEISRYVLKLSILIHTYKHNFQLKLN